MDNQLPAAKILHQTRNLLGKPRSFGDTLTAEEVEQIPRHVQKALVNTGKLEIFAKNNEGLEIINLRIEALEEKVELMLKTLEAGAVKAPAPAKKRGRPRKDS